MSLYVPNASYDMPCNSLLDLCGKQKCNLYLMIFIYVFFTDIIEFIWVFFLSQS